MTTTIKSSRRTTAGRKGSRVEVQAAVSAAIDAFHQFYPGLIYSNLQLEEVDEDDKGYWLITLGYDIKRKLSPLQAALHTLHSEDQRAYKVFKIDRANGRVVSMKMRVVA